MSQEEWRGLATLVWLRVSHELKAMCQPGPQSSEAPKALRLQLAPGKRPQSLVTWIFDCPHNLTADFPQREWYNSEQGGAIPEAAFMISSSITFLLTSLPTLTLLFLRHVMCNLASGIALNCSNFQDHSFLKQPWGSLSLYSRFCSHDHSYI